MLNGLIAMLYLNVLDVDCIIADIGLNDQMSSKKQEFV